MGWIKADLNVLGKDRKLFYIIYFSVDITSFSLNSFSSLSKFFR